MSLVHHAGSLRRSRQPSARTSWAFRCPHEGPMQVHLPGVFTSDQGPAADCTSWQFCLCGVVVAPYSEGVWLELDLKTSAVGATHRATTC